MINVGLGVTYHHQGDLDPHNGTNAIVDIFNICNPARLVRQDAPEPWQIGFQDPATPVAEGIQDLHHDVFFLFL